MTSTLFYVILVSMSGFGVIDGAPLPLRSQQAKNRQTNKQKKTLLNRVKYNKLAYPKMSRAVLQWSRNGLVSMAEKS